MTIGPRSMLLVFGFIFALSAVAQADAKLIEDCFLSCRGGGDKEFVMCMNRCRACDGLCGGLSGTNLHECRQKCESVAGNVFESGDDHGETQRIAVTYELYLAILTLKESLTQMNVVIDPVFGIYVTYDPEEIVRAYKKAVSNVDQLVALFVEMQRERNNAAVSAVALNWENFKENSAALMKEYESPSARSPCFDPVFGGLIEDGDLEPDYFDPDFDDSDFEDDEINVENGISDQEKIENGEDEDSIIEALRAKNEASQAPDDKEHDADDDDCMNAEILDPMNYIDECDVSIQRIEQALSDLTRLYFKSLFDN